MLFCPTCGNMLQVEGPYLGHGSRFYCPTCAYIYPIDRKITIKHTLKKKKVDQIFSGEDALKNAPKTQAACPYCNHNEAYFKQLQIRSADEPMTTFYNCCNCKKHWKDD